MFVTRMLLCFVIFCFRLWFWRAQISEPLNFGILFHSFLLGNILYTQVHCYHKTVSVLSYNCLFYFSSLSHLYIPFSSYMYMSSMYVSYWSIPYDFISYFEEVSHYHTITSQILQGSAYNFSWQSTYFTFDSFVYLLICLDSLEQRCSYCVVEKCKPMWKLKQRLLLPITHLKIYLKPSKM